MHDFTAYDRKLHLAHTFSADAELAWHDVFPHSSCETHGDSQGNFVLFHGYLCHKPERSGSLLARDPIEYTSIYRGESLGMSELLVGVYVKSPQGAETVYHLSKLEPISLYRPTHNDLLSRFHEIRRLVLNNLQGLAGCGCDVNKKLGV